MPSIPVLGKRKDTDPCRSHFPDETEEEEKEEAYMGSSEVTEEASGGGEKEEEGDDAETEEEEEEEETCIICSKEGHWHFRCPWKVAVPSGPIPDVGDGWMVACKRCGAGDFDDLLHCTYCGCSVKYVILKRCHLCLKTGHVDNADENCLLYGKKLTRENDPCFREFLRHE